MPGLKEEKRTKNAEKKFGSNEKVRIFAARLRNNGRSLTILETDNEVKEEV